MPTYPNYDFVAQVDFDFSNERIRTSVNSVEDLHRRLYLSAEAAGGAAKAFYLSPSFTALELVPGSYTDRDHYNTTPVTLSFVNFVVDYIAKQRSFWWYPISQVQPSDLDTFWIENNGATTLMSALNASLFQASSASEGTSATVALSNYAVLGVALVVFTLVAMGAILPATAVVLAEQDSIFNVFGQVPVKIVRHLRDTLAAKILALKQAEESNGEDMALDMSPWGEGEGGSGALAFESDASMSAAAAAAASAAAAAQELSSGRKGRRSASPWCRCCASASASASPPPSSAASARTFRRATDKQALLTARLLWPVIFFCLYFVLTFWWRQTVNANATFFRAEVLWGAELQVLIPTVAYSLRNTLVYGSSARWVPTWFNATQEQLGLASELVDSLSYGSPARGLRPALSTSPTAYRILLENGCVHNEVDAATCANYGKRPCDYFYRYNFCFKPPDNVDIYYPVFYNGVVGTGLLPALRQFLLLTRNLLTQRSADLAAARGAPGAAAALPRIDLSVPPLSIVDQLGRQYLPAGLEALTTGRIAESSAYLNQFGDLNLMATLLCVLALGLFYVLLYRPLFASLDRDIKGTRGLLLLLPDDAARAVPAVMSAGKRLLGV